MLPADAGEPGDDVFDVLPLREEVIEFEINPDRAYALSLRGVGREAALAYGVPFNDPADRPVPQSEHAAYDVVVEDPVGCPVFPGRSVTGFDPSAPTPDWMARRIQLAGMRPISLAVDVTNYVMLELGQPIHGFDRDKLAGPIVVRRARAGRAGHAPSTAPTATLSTEDLLITDDTGPIGLAGVMGGETTELSEHDDEHLHRGRALGPGRDLPHRAAAQAAVGGVQAVRARHRPDHPARGGRPGGRAADDPRRRHGRGRRDVRRRAAGPRGHHDRRRAARPGHRHGDPGLGHGRQPPAPSAARSRSPARPCR